MFEWVPAHIDNIVAAANFTTVVLMVMLGGAASYMLVSKKFDHHTDIRTLLLGIAIEAYAWGLHRLYWGTWHTLRAWGYEGWNIWFVEHSFLSLIPATLVLVGLTLILSPVWGFFNGGHVPGRKYIIIPAGFMVSVWWFFFVFITSQDAHPDKPSTPTCETVFKLDKREAYENRSVCHSKE